MPLGVEMLKQTSKLLRSAAVTMRKEEAKRGRPRFVFLKKSGTTEQRLFIGMLLFVFFEGIGYTLYELTNRNRHFTYLLLN